MKGIFFQKPAEFGIIVSGENWSQGATVSGTLKIKNHGADTLTPSSLQVALAYGEIKKVEKKATDAFEILHFSEAPSLIALGPQQESAFDWKFELDRNCAITEPGGSLYLLYGMGQHPAEVGSLQLRVTPRQVFVEMIEVLQNSFHFVVKGWKSKGEWVEVKLAPPQSRSFASLDHLFVSLKSSEGRFNVKYLFNTKELDATAGSMSVKKLKKQFEQEFAENDFLFSNGHLDKEKASGCIAEVLQEVGLMSAKFA